MSRVDFFIAGVQKAGTTALDSYLRKVPGVQMADRKALHFFDKDRTNWGAPTYNALERHFMPGAFVRGEATPIYTYWPCCLERIRQYNDAARIIVILRQPAHRAYAHWRMETTRGAEKLSFFDAISDAGRARMAGKPHRVFSYVERGFYAGQARRVLELFPQSQVLFMTTDGLWNDPTRTVGEVLPAHRR
jgi:hypothetical protein